MKGERFSEGLEFTLVNDGSCYSVTKYTGAAAEVVIPSVYNSLSVKNIGYRAFYDCACLKSIVIPDAVTGIGDSAFTGCNCLTAVFYGGTTVWNVNLHYGNDVLRKATVYYYSEALNSDGRHWRYGADGVTPVVWGNEAEVKFTEQKPAEIKPVVPVSKEAAGLRVCSHEEGTKGLEYELSADKTFCSVTRYAGMAAEVIIPSVYKSIPVKYIKDYAFENCINITSIKIPAEVTAIGDGAFSDCCNLVNITMPDSINNIGDWAFDGCKSLKSTVLPRGITDIGASLFSGCAALLNVEIPYGVTNIGASAFTGCGSLTNINIPGSVRSIDI